MLKKVQIKYLEHLAKKGDHESAFKLAEYCLKDKKNSEGFEWIKISADLGNREAQYILGKLYTGISWASTTWDRWLTIDLYILRKLIRVWDDNSHLVEEDLEEAKKWLLLSAAQNWGPAQVILLGHRRFSNDDDVDRDAILDSMLANNTDINDVMHREFQIYARHYLADLWFENWEYEEGTKRKIRSKKKKQMNIKKCIVLYYDVISLYEIHGEVEQTEEDAEHFDSPINDCLSVISELNELLNKL